MPKAYSYVRFSHALQREGDSRRRQTQSAEEYAKKHGLELVETFFDLGISAYRGKNAKGKSELAVFLELLKAGKIAQGSYLLVESLDRLSRAKVLTAFGLFNEILAAGVTIVTLTDGQKYTAEGMNDPGSLFVSLGAMLRAHDESRHKSARRQQAWLKHRADAVTGKRTAIKNCPAWLKPNAAKDGFELIPERVQIVKQMFDWSEKGLGVYTIARMLNKKGIAPWGPARKPRTMRAWGTSSVAHVLNNRAVLGEHQFHELDHSDGKRTRRPVLRPIEDYYPRVINNAQFHRVQQALQSRRIRAGRKGRFYSNLFAGLLDCAYCGATVWYVNKGSYAKNRSGHYVQCSKAQHSSDCHADRWRYMRLEGAVLQYLRGLDPRALAGNLSDAGLLTAEQNLAKTTGELSEVGFKIRRLLELDSENISEVRDRLQSLQQRRSELEQMQAKLQAEIESSKPEVIRRQAETLVALASTVESDGKSADQIYETRASLAAEMAKLISSISIRAVNLKLISPAEHDDPDSKPSFVVKYRNGDAQVVTPDSGEDLYFASALKHRLAKTRSAGSSQR